MKICNYDCSFSKIIKLRLTRRTKRAKEGILSRLEYKYKFQKYKFTVFAILLEQQYHSYLVVLRASGLKDTSAEAKGRAIRTAIKYKQAMQKSFPLTEFESAAFGLPSTALPLERKTMSLRMLNFGNSNPVLLC